MALPEKARLIGGSGQHYFGLPDKSITIVDFMPYSVESFMERFMSHYNLPGYSLRWGEYPGYYSEKEWQPLVSLVSRLTKLKSIHYAIANSFPRSLLDAIHKHHSSCKIHIWSPQTPRLEIPSVGRIHNTVKLGESFRVVDEQVDMEVLRSPCLHAINLDYSIVRGSRKTHEIGGVIPYFIQTPGLKHIYLHLDCAWGNEFRDTIKNITERTGDPSFLASLESFSLQPYRLEDVALSQWTQAIELSTLKSLHLPRVDFPSSLNNAASALVSLERLWIGVDPGRSGWDVLSEELRCIFRRLNPLKYLCIQGLEDISFLHDILERHGPSLVGLMLPPGDRQIIFSPQPRYLGIVYPFVNDVHLKRIAQRCPNLKDLRVPIRRSKGDHAEVHTYRALGSFPSLQNLILDLYGNPRPVLSAEDGIFTNESVGVNGPPPHVSLEDALINFATDEALATAIWKEIYSHQPSRQLIRLRVSPWGYSIYELDERYVMLHLARSFLVTHGGARVVEIGREEREADRGFIAEPDEFIDERPFRVPRRITRLLNSIWPPTPNEPDWTTSWRSFPLQTDVDI